MKKIGIVTIFDENNYGNRLQNYALQETLKKEEFEVITFKNIIKCNNCPNTFMERIENSLFFVLKRIQEEIKFKKRYSRYIFFKKFDKENINTYKHYITGNNAKKIDKKFDYFIAGSDQIWNHGFRELTYIDTLQFTKSSKKISYAASLAVNDIKEKKYIDRIKNSISDFKAISVREDAGKKVIEQITGRTDVEVLVDPTMLLNEEEWNKVAKKPEYLKEDKKYILNYFLGEIPKEWENEIKKLAKEEEYEIINILEKNSKFYNTGPSEYLYLVKNASVICTDSFHSCVFSILYNKPFIVFERIVKKINMNSRIETLLKKFNLEDRKFDGKIKKENLEFDYENVKKILEVERKKSFKFLKKALDG